MTTYTLDPASSLTMTLAEMTNGVTTKYWQGMDTLGQSDGTNTRLFAYDGLGSLRQMTNGATLTFNQTFDPYGNPYAKAGSATTALGYTGEATDANGFVYLRARYYNPSMGRFMQFDPSRAEVNLYGYAIGNPIGHTDSSGLCADPDAIFYDGVPERKGGVPCMYRKPVTGEVYMDKWAAGDYSPCLMCHASNAYYPVTGTSKLYSDELAAYDYTFRENYAKATAGSAVAAAVGACIGFSPCLGIAWGLYKFIDQVDDIATVVSAAFGDPNAQHGVMAVSALTIGTTDVPVNYLAAHPDEAAQILARQRPADMPADFNPTYQREHFDIRLHFEGADGIPTSLGDTVEETVTLYHGHRQPLIGSEFNLEGALKGRREFHKTSRDVGIFFTDDPARAATQYGRGGYVTRVTVPKWLADETYQIDPASGKTEWKFTQTGHLEYLNEHRTTLSFMEAIKEWVFGGSGKIK